MARNKWKSFAMFDYYTTSHGCVSAWLRGNENASWGWQWGVDGGLDRNPILHIQIGRVIVLSLELFKKGFEVWFLGFWWIR